ERRETEEGQQVHQRQGVREQSLEEVATDGCSPLEDLHRRRRLQRGARCADALDEPVRHRDERLRQVTVRFEVEEQYVPLPDTPTSRERGDARRDWSPARAAPARPAGGRGSRP